MNVRTKTALKMYFKSASLIIYQPSGTMSVTGLSGLLGIVLSHLNTNSLRIIVSKLCTHNICRNLAHFHNFFLPKSMLDWLIRRQTMRQVSTIFEIYWSTEAKREPQKRGGWIFKLLNPYIFLPCFFQSILTPCSISSIKHFVFRHF